ncbi:precorrin-6A/cobalt-precorrin-6A reductase [Pseudoroseicyclus sp. H15]
MILLLAGTEEARRLAMLLRDAGMPALASFAGATAAPQSLGLPVRVGGFGGEEGFLRCLREESITAVIDATHPFAARIGPRSQRLCAGAGVPYLRLLRPGCRSGGGDDWRFIDRAEEAAELIPGDAVVWLSVGPQALPDFGNLQGRRLLVRRIDPVDAPFPYPPGDWIIGRPSADAKTEAALLSQHRVTHVVTKNSGGTAGTGKLAAARQLGLPVILLNRPPEPTPRVETPEAALTWLHETLPQGGGE